VTRVEPCLCGGTIRADDGLEPEAVAWHNMSLTHVVWRSRREPPTAAPIPCDVSRESVRASVPLVRRVS
jgi:hypothetical protein